MYIKLFELTEKNKVRVFTRNNELIFDSLHMAILFKIKN